jgi:hypothetical protein
MRLSENINVTPPPFSDNAGNITYPAPIITDELHTTFNINTQEKTINVNITNFPLPLFLFVNDSFDELNGEWKQSILETKLLQLLGTNPSLVLRSLFPRTMEEDPNGPGTQLSRMIKSLGIHMSDSCSCRRHAISMNEQGNDWCEQNIDTVVGWIKEEAKRRGLPFVDMIGKVMVNRAIKKSRKLLANQPVPENDEDLDQE